MVDAMANATPHDFSALSPDVVMSAVESVGFYPAAEPFALNSYENRVLMFQDDDRARWVVKFYRPARWSSAAIQEEHDFLTELDQARVPVSAPWRDGEGQSLFVYQGLRFALFRQCAGQAPELDNPAHLFALGEALGALHQQGAQRAFEHRHTFDFNADIKDAEARVLASGRLNHQQRRAYSSAVDKTLAALARFDWSSASLIRTHGDCHLGNVLGRDEHFTLVDFDDAMMAPAIQDVWMLLPEDEQEWQAMLSEVVEGYEQSRPFPSEQLTLIEPLRAYRLIRYTAWLVSRWSDPAFPRAFPWVGDGGYWDQHIRQLEQQLLQLEQPRWLA
ncbi:MULTISPECIES: serine/threonine protein kinase [unclassified Halomonas]|uniref:serine/threonine protein kinase n=1 Tax=unclassified Halomonas TaxID=2609666 RepID=UPI002076A3B2|nr:MULTISPECIES: serine/threonine protein kinase [unclassified Halomonas]